MRLPQLLALVLVLARSLSLVVALPLTKCALCLSLRYALRVHESRMCECVLYVCMFCERVRMCVLVYACVPFSVVALWALFFFFVQSHLRRRAAKRKRTPKNARANNFGVFLYYYLYFCSI